MQHLAKTQAICAPRTNPTGNGAGFEEEERRREDEEAKGGTEVGTSALCVHPRDPNDHSYTKARHNDDQIETAQGYRYELNGPQNVSAARGREEEGESRGRRRRRGIELGTGPACMTHTRCKNIPAHWCQQNAPTAGQQRGGQRGRKEEKEAGGRGRGGRQPLRTTRGVYVA